MLDLKKKKKFYPFIVAYDVTEHKVPLGCFHYSSYEENKSAGELETPSIRILALTSPYRHPWVPAVTIATITCQYRRCFIPSSELLGGWRWLFADVGPCLGSSSEKRGRCFKAAPSPAESLRSTMLRGRKKQRKVPGKLRYGRKKISTRFRSDELKTFYPDSVTLVTFETYSADTASYFCSKGCRLQRLSHRQACFGGEVNRGE